MISRLQDLLASAGEGRSLVERVYGVVPVSIAEECGPEEIAEIVERLDRLAAARCEIPAWDGDASDDVWRAQEGWGGVLAALVPRFPAQVAAALASPEAGTRFWAAHAIGRSPRPELVRALDAALAVESDDLARGMMEEARAACAGRTA